MTIAGWWILGVSVGSVLGVFVWCIWMVFRTSREEDLLHGFEQTPPDVGEDRRTR